MNGQYAIRWERDATGIVTLASIEPNQPVSTGTASVTADLTTTVERLVAERESIVGIILASAADTFFPGCSLDSLLGWSRGDASAMFARTQQIKALLRTIETLGVPVVATINGNALGSGLELALAAHHRIVADRSTIQIGLPDVKFGLLPGTGGLTRTVRMLGVRVALSEVLLQGNVYTPIGARELGLIDEVVESPDELRLHAVAWIVAHPNARQPWDTAGFTLPGGLPSSPSLLAGLAAMPATLRRQLKGVDLPAPRGIVGAVVEGARLTFDAASTVESRYHVELATSRVAQNLIQANIRDVGHIASGGTRPVGYDRYRPSKVVVVGAGMMGAGIAYALALAGVQVVLRDVDFESANKGKNYSRKVLEKAVARGRMKQDAAEKVLARITPSAKLSDLDGVDAVIEAVFENEELKKEVYATIEPHILPHALVASNTSTLPITDLAHGVTQPANFIGMHFFSPVDRMPLVEIVVGEKTSEATLAAAIDITQLLRMTPIIVNDSRGFFTSRTISVRLYEALDMLSEGVSAVSIEQAALQAGYPTGPLQLYDEVTLTLSKLGLAESKKAAGEAWVDRPAYGVIHRFVDDFGRGGRTKGGGFYDYTDGKRVGLWPGLSENYGGQRNIPFVDIKERMLFAEALETARCLDENVLRSVPEANIGSIVGIGYPAWTGGVVQYIDSYDGGVAGFVARADELADRYGDRFRPPASLVATADRDGSVTQSLSSSN
jgi:3-hydroxyacyl-CoA dehydrogenase / enoyl-CoA hydratase / 3-hydroxybutyryl-CoA epimerase